MREFDELQDISDRELRDISRYAVRQKYVQFKKAGKHIVTLSKKGRNFLVRRMLSLKQPQQWDGKWRIVLFDIPNEDKSARDSFAATLKSAGFERLQKSVFISPYPCEEELEALTVQLGIYEHIDIVVAGRISREEEYKKRFQL
jgi:phenylacetic acid degradation operon negative regulatory protein